MFGNLKSKSNQTSVFKNSPPMTDAYCRSAGTSSSVTKHNEGDRLVRCRVCGWICDRERDVSLRDGCFAGLGVSYSAQKTAAPAVGDRVVPAAGSVASTPDKYYDRTVAGGCPCCGTYLFDTTPAPIPDLE